VKRSSVDVLTLALAFLLLAAWLLFGGAR